MVRNFFSGGDNLRIESASSLLRFLVCNTSEFSNASSFKKFSCVLRLSAPLPRLDAPRFWLSRELLPIVEFPLAEDGWKLVSWVIWPVFISHANKLELLV